VEIKANTLEIAGKRILQAFFRDITEQKRAASEVLRLNQELEQRVIERTAQLERTNRNLEEEIRQRMEAQEEITTLNENLLQRTHDLETVNRELETFSYSVSHDLRAPLRHMLSFCTLLQDEAGEQLDSNCRNYLERMIAANRRMGELINDLLELSRVSQAHISYSTVNLSDLASKVVADLQEGAPRQKVELFIEEGLSARGDLNLLRLVMENLLGNAWKYSSKKPITRIEVGKILKDGRDLFFVRDYGAGFDMAYSDKLFGAFQRLHGKEFEGTGVGLATVQRIIHRHGGKIWAEAEVDKGATFYFTTSPA
jgi:light-regulated signal transduction histidine kinase (bacteriophytochrome)